MNADRDIHLMKPIMAAFPTCWDGKECVLRLKEADYNWRQMEWWGFYFEYLCRNLLAGCLAFPGDKFVFERASGRRTSVGFDVKGHINWDIKAKAIKSDDHRAILNDQKAMQKSVAEYGEHGLIIGLFDVEYNDKDRSFQRWHTYLKGGESSYEKERKNRTSVSRYRKTSATLTEIVFAVVTPENISSLDSFRQGRNADGTARPLKYMINIDNMDNFFVDRILFP